MLETHDPDWEAKWDRAYAIVQKLEARRIDYGNLTDDGRAHLVQLNRVRLLLPVIFDAKHRTPNEYIAFQLSITMQQAEEMGLDLDYPWLPDDAGIDASRAAVREIVDLVEQEQAKRRNAPR